MTKLEKRWHDGFQIILGFFLKRTNMSNKQIKTNMSLFLYHSYFLDEREVPWAKKWDLLRTGPESEKYAQKMILKVWLDFSVHIKSGFHREGQIRPKAKCPYSTDCSKCGYFILKSVFYLQFSKFSTTCRS